MIKLLNSLHLNDSISIIKDVTSKMKLQGLDQWDDVYPTADNIKDDIDNNSAFGYFDNNELVAYFVLNEYYSPEYDSLTWIIKGRALILHRLSVSSNKQGKGIAKKCIQFAEIYAKDNSYNCIRLDAFFDNKIAIKMYDALGYKKAGIINLRKGKFYCFEKEIVPKS